MCNYLVLQPSKLLDIQIVSVELFLVSGHLDVQLRSAAGAVGKDKNCDSITASLAIQHVSKHQKLPVSSSDLCHTAAWL